MEKKLNTRDNPKKCAHPDHLFDALTLAEYCCFHLPDKRGYLKKLKRWIKEHNGNLKRFNLMGIDLEAYPEFRDILRGANLQEADLTLANLQKVDLSEAKLQKAVLYDANLKEADLSFANLTGAEIYGYPILTEVDLTCANLTEVKGLSKQHFIRGRGFVGRFRIGKKERGKPWIYKETYLNIKNYFLQSGRYDDASWAAYREKVLERINIFPECFEEYTELKEQPEKWEGKNKHWKLSTCWLKCSGRAILSIPRWFFSLLFSTLNGYGEKPYRVFLSAVIIVILFALLFWGLVMVTYPDGRYNFNFWDNVYFRLTTFTTIGYGDFRPEATRFARLTSGIEGFIGVFMIALFVWTLARRYSGH